MADMSDETIDMLRADLAAVEAGETEGLVFAAGHGIQSRRWRFAWENESLAVDFDLPIGRVLSDEEVQKSDNAEIAAAIRMALVLISACDRFVEPGCRLYVAHDGGTASWRVVSGDGEVLDDADDWASLAARLDAAMPEEEDVVFLP